MQDGIVFRVRIGSKYKIVEYDCIHEGVPVFESATGA